MRRSIRLAVAAAAVALGSAACGGAPCSQYCQKIIQCWPAWHNNQSCSGSQTTCVERCQEADSIDHTGDFAGMASCVTNPNLSCGDLTGSDPHCPGAQLNFDNTCQ